VKGTAPDEPTVGERTAVLASPKADTERDVAVVEVPVIDTLHGFPTVAMPAFPDTLQVGRAAAGTNSIMKSKGVRVFDPTCSIVMATAYFLPLTPPAVFQLSIQPLVTDN
jgi:hypothetical protein